MTDSCVYDEMTRIAREVLAGEGIAVHDAMMDGTGRLLDLVALDHGGNAYALWSGIADRWETAGGTDVADTEVSAREVAAAWLAVDHGSPPAIDAFFERWVTGEGG